MRLPHLHADVLRRILDWYAATLEADPATGAPVVAVSGWHQRVESGLAPTAWHQCEQCNDGTTRRGPCPNCGGQAGWYVDPYDRTHRRIATADTGQPRAMTLAELDRALGDLPMLRDLAPSTAPALARLEEALLVMRQIAPHHRGALVCVHILRVPARRDDLYDDALTVLGLTLGPRFRAPGWAREHVPAVPRKRVA